MSDDAVFGTVNGIINDIRKRGDQAVVEYTNRFDRMSVSSMSDLEIPLSRLQQALEAIGPEQRAALEQAAARITAYAEHQKLESWSYTEADGTVLGQQINPMDRVGLYVPGGKAA
ncbi:MAG: histidinol dehydrogenase, partial [Thiolinea sp.]